MAFLFGVDRRRVIPPFARKTLLREYAEFARTGSEKTKTKKNVVLFADVYTQYNNPRVGIAAIRLFGKLASPLRPHP